MIGFVPPSEDPCAILAAQIVARHRAQLPDLTGAVVLLPGYAGAARLRECLLQEAAGHGFGALLGPSVSTMRDWVLQQARADDRGVPGEHARELILVEALHRHRKLFGGADPWHLADELLTLFRELTLSNEALPEDEQAFVDRLARGYGSPAALEPLRREARLVHTLWRAWHEQLDAEGLIDADARYLDALHRLAQSPPEDIHLWFAGFDVLSPSEAACIAALLERGRADVLLHGTTEGRSGRALASLIARLGRTPSPWMEGENPFSAFLSAALDEESPVPAERAARLAAAVPESPAAGRLSICTLSDAEAQALAVDEQIRGWLADGVAPIAVVCEDRRFARRLRALLERANVALDDPTGWALSTTSAAATLERWLEAVEEDFAQHALLDALKSPFLSLCETREAHLDAVHRLERDVIRHENIPRNLDRMREHLRLRRRRLDTLWAEEGYRSVVALIDAVARAAEPLLALCDARPRAPADFLDALEESLLRLGMRDAFAADPAGCRILEEIAAMRADAATRPIRMRWSEARTWLGRVLETRYFRPQTPHSPVQLLSLEQAALARYAGLIVAGADSTRLPGANHHATFFNDAVRGDLGLSTRADRVGLGLARFRRLLEAAPRVLITLEAERDGERLSPSPWVEALDTMHRLAYVGGPSPGRCETPRGEGAPPTAPSSPVGGPSPGRCEAAPLPDMERMPRPAFPARLMPGRLSASGHQDLIDCPYRFYAARGLGLAPSEEIVETLRKSEYGSRIHLCLSAFHGGEEGLPGPFGKPLAEGHRDEAVAMLEAISAEVFARDIEDNFLHRAWLARWRRLIPQYIEWAVGRAREWTVEKTEASAERTLGDGLVLNGRLDRIDRGAEGLAVIDYKTGARVPSEDDVLSGESVQLPTYALLAEGVRRVEYLLIHDKGIKTATTIEGDDLDTLAQTVRERLEGMVERLRSGAEMPAWGDEDACRHCDMSVVCRHEAWRD